MSKENDCIVALGGGDMYPDIGEPINFRADSAVVPFALGEKSILASPSAFARGVRTNTGVVAVVGEDDMAGVLVD